MKKIAKYYIFFILLLSNQFMFILPSQITDRGFTYKLMLAVSVLIILFNIKVLLKNRGFFNKNVIFFIFICILEIVISGIMYDQTISEIFAASYYNFFILVYIILSYYLDEESFKFLIKIIVYFALFLSIILLLQWYMFESYGLKFLSIDLTSSSRFGEVRINQGAFFISIGVIIAFTDIINTKKNLVNVVVNTLTITLGVLELILVSKTRAILVCLLLAIILVILIGIKEKKYKVLAFFMLIIIVFFISFLPVMQDYKRSFGAIGTDYSSIARNNAIKYYINQIKEKPIFGMGFINEASEYSDIYYLVRGNEGIFYRDDVGIIGFTNTFGMVGFVWYGVLFYKIIRLILASFKYKTIYEYLESLGLTVIVLSWSATIIITDYGKNTNLPIFLIIIEYLYKINSES